MENNNRIIKKINGLHPIDKYHFIEYIDDNGNLRISFALYYFKDVYYSLMFKEFFKPTKVTMCKKLSEYVNVDNKFISMYEAKILENNYFEDFILQTNFLKRFKNENIEEKTI